MKSKEKKEKVFSKDIRQKEFKAAFIKTLGIVSQACKMVGISKQTYYNWVNEDPEFKASLYDATEEKKDFYEAALQAAVQKGSVPAIIFANKTYNRDRGYGDQPQINVGVQLVRWNEISPELKPEDRLDAPGTDR